RAQSRPYFQSIIALKPLDCLPDFVIQAGARGDIHFLCKLHTISKIHLFALIELRLKIIEQRLVLNS
ncbi:MAG: hypothetical protein U1C58_13965, partial [Flavobacteriaceae bacterium]|nr:hypothetical protein [Flavobacteriaceae bacterium]